MVSDKNFEEFLRNEFYSFESDDSGGDNVLSMDNEADAFKVDFHFLKTGIKV